MMSKEDAQGYMELAILIERYVVKGRDHPWGRDSVNWASELMTESNRIYTQAMRANDSAEGQDGAEKAMVHIDARVEAIAKEMFDKYGVTVKLTTHCHPYVTNIYMQISGMSRPDYWSWGGDEKDGGHRINCTNYRTSLPAETIIERQREQRRRAVIR